MSIIKDGIEYGLYHKKRGFYRRFSDIELQPLIAITERQNKKFKIIKLIPYPQFQFFWERGFLPIMEKPKDKGIRVQEFINLLSQGEYKDNRHKYQGIWLRDRVDAEIYPIKNRTAERFIGKTKTEKLWPGSHLRDLPGTMIK